MDRLEVLYRGKTVRTVTGTGRLAVEFEMTVNETGWLAARAFEKFDHTIRFAHTSPVYLQAAGDAGIVTADARFFLDWMDREMAFYSKAPGFRNESHREEMRALFRSARKVYERLARGSE